MAKRFLDTRVPRYFRDPARGRKDFQLINGMRHFYLLAKDKDDTRLVFRVLTLMRGPWFFKRLRAMWASEKGRAMLSSSTRIYPYLDDRDYIKTLPEGSFGRVYMDFMVSEGLTAEGLEQEFEKCNDGPPLYDDVLDRFHNRLRDTHDILHVLSGYGRDILGEQCVLAINFAQNRNIGIGLMAHLGGLELRKGGMALGPVYRALREAHRIGKGAANIVYEDLLALLEEPIESVRARLNFPEPVEYRRAHEEMRKRGIDPRALLAKVPLPEVKSVSV